MMNHIDFLSIKPEFYVKGHQRYVTLPGKILSILTSCLLILITCFFINDLTNRKNFQVIDNKVKNTFPTINYFDLPVSISLRYTDGSPIPSNVYEISTSSMNYKSINGLANSSFINSNISQQCGAEDNNPYFNFTQGQLCTPPGLNRSLYGVFGNVDTGFNLIYFRFYKCINGSHLDEIGGYHNKTNCASQEIIDKSLNDARIFIEFLDTTINHQDIEPFTKTKHSLIFPVSTNIFKDININYQNVQYESDFGFVLDEIEIQETFKYHSNDIMINIRNYPSGFFSSLKLIMIDEKAVYTRKYMKLQVTLANIGGFTKFILLMSQTIVNLLSDKFYFLYLVDKLFILGKRDNNSKNFQNSSNINKKESEVDNKDLFKELGIKFPLPQQITNNYIICNNTTNPIYNNNETNPENLNNYTFSEKLKSKLLKSKQSVSFISLIRIQDLLFSICKRNKIIKFNEAKLRIKKILSSNTLLKMYLKIENLIDIIFRAEDKVNFKKLKRMHFE